MYLVALPRQCQRPWSSFLAGWLLSAPWTRSTGPGEKVQWWPKWWQAKTPVSWYWGTVSGVDTGDWGTSMDFLRNDEPVKVVGSDISRVLIGWWNAQVGMGEVYLFPFGNVVSKIGPPSWRGPLRSTLGGPSSGGLGGPERGRFCQAADGWRGWVRGGGPCRKGAPARGANTKGCSR